MSKTRESGVELLRIVAILGVVLLHYNNPAMGGAFTYSSGINYYMLTLLECFAICGVNLFLMVSGYFLYSSPKRSYTKVFELILQVILFDAAFYIMSVVTGAGAFSVGDLLFNMLPNNYYVILYAALYLISPFLNVMLHRLNDKHFKYLVGLAVVLFAVWTTVVDWLEILLPGRSLLGLSTVGAYGSQMGYTIVNFVLVYLIGAYIKRFKDDVRVSCKLVISIFVLGAVLFLLRFAEMKLGSSAMIVWNYNNPLIILMSALIFILFKNIKVKSAIINELAKGSFTCFLFHAAFLHYMKIEWASNQAWYIQFLHLLIVVIGLYLASYVVYKIYYLCTHWLVKIVNKKLSKFDFCVEI